MQKPNTKWVGQLRGLLTQLSSQFPQLLGVEQEVGGEARLGDNFSGSFPGGTVGRETRGSVTRARVLTASLNTWELQTAGSPEGSCCVEGSLVPGKQACMVALSWGASGVCRRPGTGTQGPRPGSR